jgi:serine/threonine-protein kinase
LLLGKTLDGRYEIEDILGQGGMGMVYRATQTSVKRPVAVKTLHASLATAPTFFERFRREAEVASQLSHPNIITVFDFGQAPDGTCYFVMELLEGLSLKELVKDGGPLSLRRTVNIIEQAARGLAHAHAMGAVHRDLKPHNIMVQPLDGMDYVKVLDFGLVKALEQEEDEHLTSTGQVLGTPQYMPPEQAGGEDVDQRSDLYSLGGVFFYCLTGGSPFGANTVRKALMASLNGTVPTVNSKRNGAPVPRKVDEFLRKALAREKKDRHPSAEAFIDDMLDSVADLSDEELDAAPNGPMLSDAGGGSSSRGSKSSGGSPVRRGSSPIAGRSRSGVGLAGGRSRSSASPPPDPGQLTISKPRATRPELPSVKVSDDLSGQAEDGEAQASGKLPLFAAVGSLLLLGVMAVVFFAHRGAPPPAAGPTPLPIAVPTQPVKAGPSETVTVQFTSDPAGAGIFENGQSLGQTPTTLRFSRATPHALELRLAGYDARPLAMDLSHLAGDSTTYAIALTRTPAKHVEPKKTAHDDIPIFQ